MAMQVIMVDNIDLNTLKIEDGKLKVNVANVVPVAKADQFLKSVTANVDGSQLQFVVGTAEGADNTINLPTNGFLKGLASESTVTALTSSLEQAKQTIDSLTSQLNDAKGKITTLEQSESARFTKDALIVALSTDTTLKNAIKDALRGEEVQSLDGTSKGHLIGPND